MERTPPQIQQMKTWAEERDAILGEIRDGKIERDGLQAENLRLAESNKDITIQIATKTVALAKLESEDKARILTVSEDVVEMEKKKARLEITVGALSADIREKRSQKAELTDDIKLLTQLHDKAFSRTGVLDKVIDRVVRVSEGNIQDVQSFASAMREVLTQLSDAFEKTVESGTKAIEGLKASSETFAKRAQGSIKKKTKKGINS